MAKLLRGADTARVLTERLKGEAAALSARGVVPTLAILRVGEREDDLSYERGAMKRCEQIGIAVRRFLLPSGVTQEKLLETVDSINADPEIDGCLIFRPLPGHLDDGQVRARLLPTKDVDGITDGSMSAVYSGSGQGFSPCTAQACIEILKNSGISLSGKRVTVVGQKPRDRPSGRDAAAGRTCDGNHLPHPDEEPARRLPGSRNSHRCGRQSGSDREGVCGAGPDRPRRRHSHGGGRQALRRCAVRRGGAGGGGDYSGAGRGRRGDHFGAGRACH